MADLCNCHGKHSEAIQNLKHVYLHNEDVHKALFEHVDKKLDCKWLIAGVALFLFWMSFQLTMFDTISKMKTDVAVIQTNVEAISIRIKLMEGRS